MLPISTVLGMLASMALSNHIFTQTAVSAAATAAGISGGAAGAAAGVAAARPGLAFEVIKLPFRIVHAPFYYISGQHKLHAALARTEEAVNAYVSTVEGPWKQVGDIQITATREFVNAAREYATATTNPKPIDIPIFDAAIVQTPDGNQLTTIFMSQSATNLVIAVATLVGSYVVIRVLVFAFRRSIKYSIRAFRAVTSLIEEEKAKENNREQQRTLEKSYTLPLNNQYNPR